jgi:3-deoxy-manno-octulosonate cytidylyltransferase (CMP-KDO synthetase)
VKFTVLIPARLASTRLPNKPLADLGGLPMIVRVAQRVRSGLDASTKIVVAADSPAILQACEDHGVAAVLTRTNHPSGSDRLAEACDLLEISDDSIVVNVQGDEPLIDPDLVKEVAQLLHARSQASMSTAAHPIDNMAEFVNPNVVKVVLDAERFALYFSRAAIPHWRDAPTGADSLVPQPPPLRHIGLYAYRARFLRLFPKLSPAPHELTESLEQLRALWHGHRIAVQLTSRAPLAGVDTPEDLQRVRQLMGY